MLLPGQIPVCSVIRVQPDPLRPRRLYIVEEDHRESRERREEEKAFAVDLTGGKYWEEQEFTEFNQPVDTNEIRALHAAAELIRQYQAMTDAARALAQIKPEVEVWSKAKLTASAGPPPPAAGPAGVPVETAHAQFLAGDLAGAVWYWQYLQQVWVPAPSPAVKAAAGSFDQAKASFEAFFASLQVAVQALAGSFPALENLVPPLAELAGLPANWEGNPEALSGFLRQQRSRLMGEAAARSLEVGVWKVGAEHFTDILRNQSIPPGKVHKVARADFNDLFRLWLTNHRQLTNDQLRAGLKTQVQSTQSRALRPK